MACYKFNATKELKKVAKGQKSKAAEHFGVGFLVYESLRDYPAAQKKIGKIFDISNR